MLFYILYNLLLSFFIQTGNQSVNTKINIKKMDLGTAIVGLIIIAICSIPVFIMGKNKKKRERAILQKLTDLAQKEGCKISNHEINENYALGLDEQKNQVFFVKKHNGSFASESADLSKVQKVEVLNTKRTVDNNGSIYSVVEKLSLGFIPTSKGGTQKEFNFFDREYNTQLTGELESIEKWANLINKRVSQN